MSNTFRIHPRSHVPHSGKGWLVSFYDSFGVLISSLTPDQVSYILVWPVLGSTLVMDTKVVKVVGVGPTKTGIHWWRIPPGYSHWKLSVQGRPFLSGGNRSFLHQKERSYRICEFKFLSFTYFPHPKSQGPTPSPIGELILSLETGGAQSLSRVWLFVAPWTVAHQAPLSMDTPLSMDSCPGKNTGVGCHFLLQGIFLIWGVKPGSPVLAGRFFILSHLGKPPETGRAGI